VREGREGERPGDLLLGARELGLAGAQLEGGEEHLPRVALLARGAAGAQRHRPPPPRMTHPDQDRNADPFGQVAVIRRFL